MDFASIVKRLQAKYGLKPIQSPPRTLEVDRSDILELTRTDGLSKHHVVMKRCGQVIFDGSMKALFDLVDNALEDEVTRG